MTGQLCLTSALLLAGCGMMPGRDAPDVDPLDLSATLASSVAPTAEAAPRAPALDPTLSNGEPSPLIQSLLARRASPGSPAMAQVAAAVMAANARTKEAELRAAMLTAQATETNWLPTLGPTISLTSLGDTVARMALDAVIFDNGGKRAEREAARADVEVAAAALAMDSNARVAQALSLYVTAEAARTRAEVSEAGLSQMTEFRDLIAARVSGGVSDRGELALVTERLGRLRSDITADRLAERTAMAELSSMVATPVDALRGTAAPTVGDHEPPSVLKATAEATRADARARMARAGFLPGIGASASLGSGGGDGGLTVAIPNGIGLGTGAQIEAARMQAEAARGAITDARQSATRRAATLAAQAQAARGNATAADARAAEAGRTFDLYAAQLRAGRRSVPEAAGAFMSRIDAAREGVTLRHEALAHDIARAAIFGALVDGDRI
ncbi:MAG: TolC family protein [Paracoccaceae bacterium]